jgi:hypothetical protein
MHRLNVQSEKMYLFFTVHSYVSLQKKDWQNKRQYCVRNYGPCHDIHKGKEIDLMAVETEEIQKKVSNGT